MGAHQTALLLQGRQVVADGHRRDPKALDEFGDRDAPLFFDQGGDLAQTFL